MTRAPRILDQKYRLGKILHQNERALILAATHVELREHVIVKVLDAESRDPRFAAKLRREARQATAIRSEHVVRYLDIGHLVDGRPYVVMERLVGETLSERLRSGPLSLTDTIDAILQTCEALACAHVRGILHRDLRTANLFALKQRGSRMAIKVLNFGTSRGIDARGSQEDQGLTVAVLAVDAPDYKAPEQLVSGRDLDARVDIWALGVVLYELLTGERPFSSDNPQDVVRRVLMADVAPRPQIPPQLWPILHGCLAPRADGRWANVADLADALAPFGSPATAAYPARIRQMLETAPTEALAADGDEEEDAPTMVGDMLALTRKEPDAPQSVQLPRIDDGRTSARSFPWLTLPVKSSTDGATVERNRIKLVAIFGTTLLSAVIGLALLVPRFVVDLHVEARDSTKKGAASVRAHDPPLPPPPAASTASDTRAIASATPDVTASAPVVAPKADRVARSARSAPNDARTKSAPASSSSASSAPAGDDPWGWQR